MSFSLYIKLDLAWVAQVHTGRFVPPSLRCDHARNDLVLLVVSDARMSQQNKIIQFQFKQQMIWCCTVSKHELTVLSGSALQGKDCTSLFDQILKPSFFNHNLAMTITLFQLENLFKTLNEYWNIIIVSHFSWYFNRGWTHHYLPIAIGYIYL